MFNKYSYIFVHVTKKKEKKRIIWEGANSIVIFFHHNFLNKSLGWLVEHKHLLKQTSRDEQLKYQNIYKKTNQIYSIFLC